MQKHCSLLILMCFGSVAQAAGIVEFYEGMWGGSQSYTTTAKVVVGPTPQVLTNLPDHVLPMPPLGMVWQRHEDRTLTLHAHRDYRGALPEVELLTFADKTHFAYLNRHNNITIEGYTDYVKSEFTDAHRRFPFKTLTDGAIPRWRAHLLEHSRTIGEPRMTEASTYLLENYHPEPFGYWAQNGANSLMEVGKGYKRLLIYPFNPDQICAMDGKRKIVDMPFPTGTVFSQYAPGVERNYQCAYSIPYGNHPVHSPAKDMKADILLALKDKRSTDTDEGTYIRPIVLHSARSRSELSRSFFYKYIEGVDPTTYKTSTLADQEGLRLHAENEANGIEGKMFYLLNLLTREEDVPPHVLQYVSRALGHHALFLDDVQDSHTKVVDATWVEALRTFIVSRGFQEDDSLVDILRRIVGNQSDVSTRSTLTFNENLTFVLATSDARRRGSPTVEAFERVPMTPMTLTPLTGSKDFRINDLGASLRDQLKGIASKSHPHRIDCAVHEIATKNMNVVAGIIKDFLDANKQHSIHLHWSLTPPSNPRTVKERLDNLIMKFPSGRLSHMEATMPAVVSTPSSGDGIHGSSPPIVRAGSAITISSTGTLSIAAEGGTLPLPSSDLSLPAHPTRMLDFTRIYTEAGYDRLMERVKALISDGTITVDDILNWAGYSLLNKKQNFSNMTKPSFAQKEKRWNNLVKNTSGTTKFEVLFGISSTLTPDTAGGPEDKLVVEIERDVRARMEGGSSDSSMPDILAKKLASPTQPVPPSEVTLTEPYSLRAIFNRAPIIFQEEIVADNGDCGFIALGTDRDRAIEQLLEVKDRVDIRDLVSPEIKAAFIGDDLPIEMKSNSFYLRLSGDYAATKTRLDEIVREKNDALGFGEGERKGAEALVAYLAEHEQSEEATLVADRLESVARAEREIEEYCHRAETYEAFINNYLGKGGWLSFIPKSTATLDALARINTMNVYIWQKDPRDPVQLTLAHEAPYGGGGAAAGASPTIHILHTHGGTHFNLLTITK